MSGAQPVKGRCLFLGVVPPKPFCVASLGSPGPEEAERDWCRGTEVLRPKHVGQAGREETGVSRAQVTQGCAKDGAKPD